MAKRLKKTSAARPSAAAYVPAPVVRPAHQRETEWNGFKQGDPVRVLRDGRRAQWKYRYQFMAHVTAPDGTTYLDVLETARGEHRGLWRSFPIDKVVKEEPRPAPRRRVAEE